MSTIVNLSVGSGETKNLTFNCGGTFVPDDIEFVITGSGGDTNTTLSGVAYCSTGASTTAKTATMPGFALSSGQRIILYLSATNTKASATLNVNSTGAKTIKINGSNTTTSNFTAGYWICNYDGSYWNAEKMDNSKMANSAGYTTNTGTVTSVGLSNAANGGLTISGSPITGSGSITIGHSNVLESAQSTQAVYPITIDKNGHIASYGSAVTIPTSSGSHSGVAYCSTAANTGAKVANLPGFSISTESPFKTHAIILYVLNSNTYSGTCTLNVNGIGAMGMRMWDGSSWSTVSGNMLKSGYYYCYFDGNSNSEWYLRPFSSGGNSGSIVCTNSSSGTTNTAVSSGDVYLNYVENGSVVDSIALHGMGGTTITSTVVSGYPPQIRINSTTGGGGGGAEYLNDLYDVYTSPYNGQFLQYNGSGWTGAAALTQINAGSGLNATSGNTTNDGGNITASTSSANNPPVTSTGTLHLTRVNTDSSYNDGNNNTLTKIPAGPTSDITVSSSSNTFNVPYLNVDKFGRVTNLTNRTITINGLGGGGGGSAVSATGSETQTLGYNVGSITIDGGTTYFRVSPARVVQSGGSSSGAFSFQGVVRPIAEVTMSDTEFSEIDGGVSVVASDIAKNCSIADAPDYAEGGVFIPITMLYHYNYITTKWESVPYLFIPNDLSETFGQIYTSSYRFPR